MTRLIHGSCSPALEQYGASNSSGIDGRALAALEQSGPDVLVEDIGMPDGTAMHCPSGKSNGYRAWGNPSGYCVDGVRGSQTADKL